MASLCRAEEPQRGHVGDKFEFCIEERLSESALHTGKNLLRRIPYQLKSAGNAYGCDTRKSLLLYFRIETHRMLSDALFMLLQLAVNVLAIAVVVVLGVGELHHRVGSSNQIQTEHDDEDRNQALTHEFSPTGGATRPRIQ